MDKKVNSSSPTLNYLVRKGISENGTATPALILLHGYGSNKEDLFSFAPYLPKNYTVIALEAPYQLMENAFAWYALHFDAPREKWSDLGQAKKSMEMIREHINYCIATYQLHPTAISLLGFSQGAILSWALKLNYPEEFHRIIGLSGYIHTELISKPLNEIRELIAFASHGVLDQVLPISLARDTIGMIQKENPQLQYNEYEEGHTISAQNFSDLLHWLNQTL